MSFNLPTILIMPSDPPLVRSAPLCTSTWIFSARLVPPHLSLNSLFSSPAFISLPSFAVPLNPRPFAGVAGFISANAPLFFFPEGTWFLQRFLLLIMRHSNKAIPDADSPPPIYFLELPPTLCIEATILPMLSLLAACLWDQRLPATPLPRYPLQDIVLCRPHNGLLLILMPLIGCGAGSKAFLSS